METTGDLTVCDLCGAQGPHRCRQIMDELAVQQTTYQGQPARVVTLPGDELEPMCGVLCATIRQIAT